MKAATTFAPRADVQEIITNRIIMALENGVTPWKKPALVKSLVQRLNERPLGGRINAPYCAEVGARKVPHTERMSAEMNLPGK